jgi:hypothetical protein
MILFKDKIKRVLREKDYDNLRRIYRIYLLNKRKLSQVIASVIRKIQNYTIKHFLKVSKKKTISLKTRSGGKPHLLLLVFKYNSGLKTRGLSTESNNVSGSLKASNLATFKEFFYDFDYKYFFTDDVKLIDTCINEKPDAIILSSYTPSNLKQPPIETIKIINDILNIPIFAIFWDSVSADFNKYPAKQVVENSDMNIIIESSVSFNNSPSKNKFIQLWAAQDPNIFFNDFRERDIDISFIGSTGSYRSYREIYINHLLDNGINIFLNKDESSPITFLAYANIMRKSKITLNFSVSTLDRHQVKGRVFEAMFCGSCLMESENSETSKFFKPMVDYVPYSSKEDLLEKTRYYLTHERERKQIALNGYKKVCEKYNHTNFWKNILDIQLPKIKVNKLPPANIICNK